MAFPSKGTFCAILLVSILSCQGKLLAGKEGSASHLIEWRDTREGDNPKQFDITPSRYHYPSQVCGEVPCHATEDYSLNGSVTSCVPSIGGPTTCTSEGDQATPKCFGLERSQSSLSILLDTIGFKAHVFQYIPLGSFVDGVPTTTTYFLASDIPTSPSKTILVGVIPAVANGDANSRPKVDYINQFDLHLSSYADLVISPVWKSQEGSVAQLVMASPTLAVILRLTNDSEATIRALEPGTTTSYANELHWSSAISTRDKCPSVTRILPDLRNDMFALVCEDGRHYVNITCLSLPDSRFPMCTVNPHLVDASSKLPHKPLEILYHHHPEQMAFYFISQTESGQLDVRIGHSLLSFDNLVYQSLSSGPILINQPFCTPRECADYHLVTYFTGAEEGRKYLYVVKINGTSAELLKLNKICMSCAVKFCSDQELVLLDNSRNWTFVYNVSTRRSTTTPISGWSHPVFTYTPSAISALPVERVVDKEDTYTTPIDPYPYVNLWFLVIPVVVVVAITASACFIGGVKYKKRWFNNSHTSSIGTISTSGSCHEEVGSGGQQTPDLVSIQILDARVEYSPGQRGRPSQLPVPHPCTSPTASPGPSDAIMSSQEEQIPNTLNTSVK